MRTLKRKERHWISQTYIIAFLLLLSWVLAPINLKSAMKQDQTVPQLCLKQWVCFQRMSGCFEMFFFCIKRERDYGQFHFFLGNKTLNSRYGFELNAYRLASIANTILSCRFRSFARSFGLFILYTKLVNLQNLFKSRKGLELGSSQIYK